MYNSTSWFFGNAKRPCIHCLDHLTHFIQFTGFLILTQKLQYIDRLTNRWFAHRQFLQFRFTLGLQKQQPFHQQITGFLLFESKLRQLKKMDFQIVRQDEFLCVFPETKNTVVAL
ncbi:Uncharacterised protein [Mycobacterium tuberculosis]|nr:Uncharacterised protein [Mycobacterium tuberculosis]